MQSTPMQRLALANARQQFEGGNPAAAREWLGLLPAEERPDNMQAAIAYTLAKTAIAEERWGVAVAELHTACTHGGGALVQTRLALARNRPSTLAQEHLDAMEQAITPASRLRSNMLQPAVTGVFAAGAYHSRGRHSQDPWSRVLRTKAR